MPVDRTRENNAQARVGSSPLAAFIKTPLRVLSKLRTSFFSSPTSPSPAQAPAPTSQAANVARSDAGESELSRDGEGAGAGNEDATTIQGATSPRVKPPGTLAARPVNKTSSSFSSSSAYSMPRPPFPPASAFRSRAQPITPARATLTSPAKSRQPDEAAASSTDPPPAPLLDLGTNTSQPERSSALSGRAPRAQAAIRAAAKAFHSPAALRMPASSAAAYPGPAPAAPTPAGVTNQSSKAEPQKSSTLHTIHLHDTSPDQTDGSTRTSSRRSMARTTVMARSSPYATPVRGRTLATDTRSSSSRLLYKTQRPGASGRSSAGPSTPPSVMASSADRYFIRATTQYAYGSSRYGIIKSPDTQAPTSDMPSFRASFAAQTSRKRPHSPEASNNSPLRFGLNDDDVADTDATPASASAQVSRPSTPPSDEQPAPKRQRSIMVDASVDPMSPPSKPTPLSKSTATGPMSPPRSVVSKSNASAQSTPTLTAASQQLTSPIKPFSISAPAALAKTGPPGPFDFANHTQDKAEDATSTSASAANETVKPAPVSFSFGAPTASTTAPPAPISSASSAASSGFAFSLPAVPPSGASSSAVTESGPKPAPGAASTAPPAPAPFAFAVPSTPASAPASGSSTEAEAHPPQVKTPENQIAQDDDDGMIISPAPSKIMTPSQSSLGGEPLKAPPTFTFGGAVSGSASSTETTAGGSAAPAPFVFGSAAPTPASGPTTGPSMFAFGSNAPASAPATSAPAAAPLFSFGNANATTSATPAPPTSAPAPFTFGSASTAPSAPAAAPAPLVFGTAASATAPTSTTGTGNSTGFTFNFGSAAASASSAPPTPSAPAFSFGAGAGTANPATSAGAFTFSAPTTAGAPPAFGAGQSAAPQPQAQQQGTFSFSFNTPAGALSGNAAPAPGAPAPFTFGPSNAQPSQPATGFGAGGGQSAGFGGASNGTGPFGSTPNHNTNGGAGFTFGAANQQQQTPQAAGFNFGQSNAPAGGPPVTPRFDPPGASGFGGMATPGFGTGMATPGFGVANGVGGMATPGAPGMFAGVSAGMPPGMPATPQGQGGGAIGLKFDAGTAGRKKYVKKPKK